MFRKSSIWTRYLLLQSALAIKKPCLIPIGAKFSTKQQLANSPFMKKPSFTAPKARVQPIIESKNTETNPQRGYPAHLIDNIMKDTLNKCKHLLSSESQKSDESQINLNTLHSELLASYNKIFKILSLQPELESLERDIFKTKEVYISNSVLKDEKLLIQIDGIATDLLQIYQTNEQSLFSNPGTLMYGIMCLSKFERLHDHHKIWDIVYRCVEKLLQEAKSHKQLDWNMMISFLITLSRHRFYCRMQSKERPSGEATRRRQEIKNLESELFDCIIENKHQINIAGWASILSNFHFTRDGFSEIVLNQMNSIVQIVNNPQHLVKALIKLEKINQVPEYSEIYAKLKELVMESLQTNSLSFNEISQLTKAFKDDKNFTDQEFMILWNNILHKLEKKDFEGLNLYSISMMMTNLSAYKQFSQKHSLVLQDYALIALENFDINPQATSYDALEREESEATEGAESLEKIPLNVQIINKTLIRPIVSILGNLIHNNEAQFLNPELFKRIFQTIEKNVGSIRKETLRDIVRFSGRFVEIISEKCKTDKGLQNLQNEARVVYDLCHTKLQSESGLQRHRDVVQIFRRDCALGKINEKSFGDSKAKILDTLETMETNLCTYILEGIHLIKTNSENQTVDTDSLEEVTVKKILANLKSLSKDEFKVLFTVFQPILNSKLTQELDKTLRQEFIERIDSFSIQESSKIIFGLNLKKLPKMRNFLTKLAPFMNQKIPVDKANLNDLFFIMATYRNSHLYAPSMISDFEAVLERELKKMLKSGEKTSEQGKLREVFCIFEDYSFPKSQENKLAKVFENIFRKFLSTFTLQQLVTIVSGMTKYMSTDISLLKDCLIKLDGLLNDELNRNNFLKVTKKTDLIKFNEALLTLKVMYENQIDVNNLKAISTLCLALPKYLSSQKTQEKGN